MFGSTSDVLEVGFPTALLPRPPSFTDFSAKGVLAAEPRADSNGFPGDLGVFAEAEPNEANAPEPRPKALEAPPVGDARPPPGVVMELKGLDFPCEELSPPNRLEKGALRPDELSPGPPEPDVLRERLLELELQRGQPTAKIQKRRVWGVLGTATP